MIVIIYGVLTHSLTHLFTDSLTYLPTLSPGCTLTFQDKTFPCSWGRNGITLNKVEGDGCTPIGSFPLRRIFYRSGMRVYMYHDDEIIAHTFSLIR